MSDNGEPLHTKRELARQVLDELFASGQSQRISIPKAVRFAEVCGVGYRTLRRVAAEEYGVLTVRQGAAAGFWQRPVSE